MNDLENLIKFHEYVFGRNPGIMWEHLKKDPKAAVGAILDLAKNPPLQTMETGFLLGACLLYAMQTDPLGVGPMLNAMDFQLRVKKNDTRKS